MNDVLAHQIWRNLEIYVDDMIVKTIKGRNHAKDFEDVPQFVRKYDMRLIPDICSFGVNVGNFMGFMLAKRGIQANPNKCKAIISMRSPTKVKEVEQLTWSHIHGIIYTS